MLRKLFLFFCMCAMVACSPVAAVPTNTLEPVSSPIPTATNTPTIAVSLTPRPTSTRHPTPTPTDTPLPTETIIPVAPLIKHEWQPKPVLVKMDSGGGDGCCLFSYPPDFVFYANGRLLLVKGVDVNGEYRVQTLTKKLTRQETCAFLNTIDQTGFLDYDTSSYRPKNSDYFSIDGAGSTSIAVNIWKNKSGTFFGLWSYIYELNSLDDVGAPPIPPSLKNTIYFLNSFMPEKMEIYFPERLGLVVIKDEDVLITPNSLVRDWPFPNLILDEIEKVTTNGGYPEKFYEISGESAKSVYEYFGQSYGFYGDFVVQNGKKYVVFARPLFPYEIPAFDGFNILPDPSVKSPAFTLSCYPEDGVLPIPTPTPRQ